MDIRTLDIDLDLPPEKRWAGLAPYSGEARELMAYYMAEIGDPAQLAELLRGPMESFIHRDYLDELGALARILECTEPELHLSNLYYDAIKHAFGCTAFAVDTPDGPLHARNLDWPSRDGELARYTIHFRFFRGGELLYRIAGWPGYTGCLSGVAPGRFAVTLNSVWSNDSAEYRTPITYLLRSVLGQAKDFDEAVKVLRDTEVASDSLILITGTKEGEMAVVERTPLRAAVRGPEQGRIVVTNDYRVLDDSGAGLESELMDTSCTRFDRASELCSSGSCQTARQALEILKDDKVQMGITVQQMLLSARLGTLDIHLPGGGN